MRRHAIAVVSLFLAGSLQATDHYVCACQAGSDSDCVAGNDANGGTLGAPKESFLAARSLFEDLLPGDAVRFCRGGAWDVAGFIRWTNDSCEASNPCIVSDYVPAWGSGNEQRPKLRRLDGQHMFELADSGNANHEEGYVFANFELLGAGVDSGAGFHLANDIDDVTIDNVLIRDFRHGVHLGSSQPCSGSDPECDGKNQRAVLKNSTILENSSQGWLGGSSGSQILDSHFEGNGTVATFDHNIYISGSNNDLTDGMRVVGNTLYRSTLDDQGRCAAAPFVVHGKHANMVIENNWVEEEVGLARPGCWGIAVDTGYPDEEHFLNITIRGNHVINTGNIAIGVTSCVGCTIENNVVVHHQAHSIRAVAAPNRQRGSEDTPLDAIVVRNNSVLIGSGSSGGTAIKVDTEGGNHIIASNAVYFSGTSNSFNCIRAVLPTAAYTDVDHNLCFYPNAPGAQWADDIGNLGAWQATTGFGSTSANVDPGFADSASGDLSAASEVAAMVDNGHPTLSSPLEIGGVPRGAQPDVGAYEWGAEGIFSDGFESGDLSQWSR